MIQSKLFDLFRSFKKEDWKNCRGYLLSRYKEETEIVALYDYIVKYKTDLNHKNLNQEIATGRLFKNKPSKNFLNLMSKMRGDVLDYMAWDHVQKDKNELAYHHLAALNARGLFAEANKYKDKFIADLQSQSPGPHNSAIQLRACHTIKFSNNPIGLKQDVSMWEEMIGKWQEYKTYLDLLYAVDGLNVAKVWGQNLSETIDAVLHGKYQLATDDVSHLLRLMGGLVQEDEKSYEEVYQMIMVEGINIETESKKIAFALLLFFQKAKIKNGTGSYKEYYDLHVRGLEEGYLLHDGVIMPNRFLAIVQLACISVTKGDPFGLIKAWSPRLEPENGKDIIAVAKSYAYLYTDQPEKVVEILSQHTITHLDSRSTARLNLLMAYFDLYPDDKDFLHTQIRNFKDFIKRNSKGVSAVNVKARKNSAKLFTHIAKGESLEKIEEFLALNQPLMSRYWVSQYLKKKRAASG